MALAPEPSETVQGAWQKLEDASHSSPAPQVFSPQVHGYAALRTEASETVQGG